MLETRRWQAEIWEPQDIDALEQRRWQHTRNGEKHAESCCGDASHRSCSDLQHASGRSVRRGLALDMASSRKFGRARTNQTCADAAGSHASHQAAA